MKLANTTIFYLQIRDVLPFTLKLPHAIATAATEADLEQVAQLGLSKYVSWFKWILLHQAECSKAKVDSFQQSSVTFHQCEDNQLLHRFASWGSFKGTLAVLLVGSLVPIPQEFGFAQDPPDANLYPLTTMLLFPSNKWTSSQHAVSNKFLFPWLIFWALACHYLVWFVSHVVPVLPPREAAPVCLSVSPSVSPWLKMIIEGSLEK